MPTSTEQTVEFVLTREMLEAFGREYVGTDPRWKNYLLYKRAMPFLLLTGISGLVLAAYFLYRAVTSKNGGFDDGLWMCLAGGAGASLVWQWAQIRKSCTIDTENPMAEQAKDIGTTHVKFTLSSAGISWQEADATSRLGWSKILRIHELPTFISFDTLDGQCWFVPRDALASPNNPAEFEAGAREAHASAGADESTRIRDYLAAYDSSCPKCLRQLRGTTGGSCLSCGLRLTYDSVPGVIVQIHNHRHNSSTMPREAVLLPPCDPETSDATHATLFEHTATYQLTRDDYATWGREMMPAHFAWRERVADQRKQMRRIGVVGVALALGCLAGIVGTMQFRVGTSSGRILSGVLGLLALLVCMEWVRRGILLRKALRNPVGEQPEAKGDFGVVALSVSARGIRWRTADSQTEMSWARILRIVELPSSITFRCKREGVLILPKRALEPDQYQALLRFARGAHASAVADEPACIRAYLGSNDFACPSCAYQLRGAGGTQCPECGLELTFHVIPEAAALEIGTPPMDPIRLSGV